MFMYIVLSTLYQEKLVTEQDLEAATSTWDTWDMWDQLIPVQCTKPLDVVSNTVRLLVWANLKRIANLLKG